MTEKEELDFLRREVQRCHERLGITHYYRYNLKTDVETRVDVPITKRSQQIDKITSLEAEVAVLTDNGPWVIFKRSRVPGKVSYTGPSWERAGLREFYKETYTSYSEALLLAKLLSRVNPVGFSVEKCP